MTAPTRAGFPADRRVVLFAGVDPLSTGESTYAWHPLAVLTVGSVLQAAGFTVTVIDCQVDHDWQDLLREHAPGATYVGVTCMTGPSIGNVLDAIDVVRESAPGVPIVWGGYHAGLASKSILRERLVDVVVTGPGERAAVGLAEHLAAGRPLDPGLLGAIPNLALLDVRTALSGTGPTTPNVFRTGYEFVADMNDLPPVDYDLIDPTRYYTPTMRDLSYITSYGCPYPCAFCTEPVTSLRKWKPLTPARIVGELRTLWQRYKPNQISLLDPNFSTNVHRVVEIVERLEKGGPRLELRANMRTRDIVNLARFVDLQRLREVGFSAIFVGCESGSDRMLKVLRKGATVEHTRQACRLLNDAGIVQLTSWIHDLPGETDDDCAQTLALCAELAALPLNQQKHHYFMPFPATELYEQLYGKTSDDGRTQREWAASDTYGGSPLYPGDKPRRTHVMARLLDLKEEFPHALVRALPRP